MRGVVLITFEFWWIMEETSSFDLTCSGLTAGTNGSVIDTFCKAIIDCSNRVGPSNHTYSLIYNNLHMITAFSENTSTPLSRFVGKHKRKVVIVSGLTQCSSVKSYDSDDIQLEKTIDTLEQSFLTITRTKVIISSILKQSKMFLMQREDFQECTLDETIAMDTNVQPLPLQTARYLSSRYALYCRQGNSIQWQQLPEVWLLCDKNIQGVVAIGCGLDTPVQTKPSLLLYQVCEGKSSMNIRNNKIYSINPNPLLGRHREVKSERVWLCSQYEFGPSMNEGNIDSIISSQIGLEFLWESTNVFFTPPPTTAEVMLSISSTPGYIYSPILAVFREIQLLVQLAEIAAGNRDWSSIVVDTEDILRITPSSSLSSRTQSFLKEASSHSLRSMDTSILSPTAHCSPFKPREDLDFVDQLWMFAHSVTDPIDLVECFGKVFKSVLLGHIQPFLHDTKHSLLSKLFQQTLSAGSKDIREVVATKLQSLLSKERALCSLVEIGLEKMERDYCYYFTSNDLATSSEIKEFFRSDGNLLERVQQLCSLHCVLELTADLLTYIALSKSTVAFFVRKALNYYQNTPPVEQFITTPTFYLPFTSLTAELKSLVGFASSLPPSSLSITTDSIRQQLVLGMVEPLFKYLSFDHIEEEEVEDINSLYVYYSSCESVPLD